MFACGTVEYVHLAVSLHVHDVRRSAVRQANCPIRVVRDVVRDVLVRDAVDVLFNDARAQW